MKKLKRMIENIILTAILCLICTSQMEAQLNNEIVIDNDIHLVQIKDSILMHTSRHDSHTYGRYSSNGLIIIKNGQAIMIDTPSDNDKTERLTKFIEDSLNVQIVQLIAGHYHEDCIGGLTYLQNRGIESIANSMTVNKCKEDGLPIPSTAFTDSLILNFNGLQLECNYHGGGHTFDNITVWIQEQNILFGGCLIRSSESKGLGYTGEAVIDEWDMTVRKVREKYPTVEIIIPGHGKYGGPELLLHTIELVEKEKNM